MRLCEVPKYLVSGKVKVSLLASEARVCIILCPLGSLEPQVTPSAVVGTYCTKCLFILKYGDLLLNLVGKGEPALNSGTCFIVLKVFTACD
jgi:hypothetical protein